MPKTFLIENAKLIQMTDLAILIQIGDEFTAWIPKSNIEFEFSSQSEIAEAWDEVSEDLAEAKANPELDCVLDIEVYEWFIDKVDGMWEAINEATN